MIDSERRALSALKFNLAPTPDDVWRPSPYNVAELHREVVEGVFDGVNLARAVDDSCPLGVVIQGPAGAGKTHMLGMVRQRTQNDGGYFFLVSLLTARRSGRARHCALWTVCSAKAWAGRPSSRPSCAD